MRETMGDKNHFVPRSKKSGKWPGLGAKTLSEISDKKNEDEDIYVKGTEEMIVVVD